jgi:hypothetical protein
MDELEDNTSSMTDWKANFRSHPVPVLGLAFGGGVLLAALLSKRKKSSRSIVSNGTHQAVDIWDNVRTAIIGAAATARLVRSLKKTWHARTV